MLPKIPYIIYFVLLLILIMPSVIMKNNKIGSLLKNISIWLILFIILIFIYQNFILI